jgi:chromosome segregation ATPase
VSRLTAELDTLRVQLDTKDQQLTSLKETLDRGMKWHESNIEQAVSSVQSELNRERKQVSSLQAQLSNTQAQLDSERKKVSSIQSQMDREVSSLRVQLDARTAEVDTLRVQLDREKKEAGSLRVQLSSKKVDTGQNKVDTGQGQVIRLDTSRPRKNGQDDNAIGEQIRALLRLEPGLSGRTIAARVGCSPTTASKWKEIIEKEQKEA